MKVPAGIDFIIIETHKSPTLKTYMYQQQGRGYNVIYVVLSYTRMLYGLLHISPLSTQTPVEFSSIPLNQIRLCTRARTIPFTNMST